MRPQVTFFALLASYALAAPLSLQPRQAAQTASPGIRIHPALEVLTDTTEAIGKLIPEVANFTGNPVDADQIEADANVVLADLTQASTLIDTGGTIDYITAIGFIPVAAPLIAATYGFLDALTDNKDNITSNHNVNMRAWRLMNRLYSAVQYYEVSLDKTLPPVVSITIRGLYLDILYRIGAARNLFRPTSLTAAAGSYGQTNSTVSIVLPSYQAPQVPSPQYVPPQYPPYPYQYQPPQFEPSQSQPPPSLQPQIFPPQVAEPRYGQPLNNSPQSDQSQYIPAGM